MDGFNDLLTIGNDKKFETFFTFLVLLYPILFIYWSGILSLSVADILLLVSCVKFMFDVYLRKKIKYNLIWLCFFVFIGLQFLAIAIIQPHQPLELGRFLRYALYIMAISFLVPNYFNVDKGFYFLKVIGKLIAIFCIIQAIGIYIFRIYIPGFISFLPIMREELSSYGADYVLDVMRVRGVFAEPAHLASYMALVLTVFLFTKTKSKYMWALIATIACLFSLSTTALFLVTFIWLYHFFINTLNKDTLITNKKILTFVLLLVAFLLIGLIFRNSELYSFFFYRFDASYSGRMGSFILLTEMDYYSDIEKLIGHGYVDFGSYLTSYPLIYFRYGYIGLTVVFITLYSVFVQSKTDVQKGLTLLFTILCVGTQSFVSNMIICYMALICSKLNKTQEL